MTEREGDKGLWEPTDLNWRTSPKENERVRALLQEELERRVDNMGKGSSEARWGHARGHFAKDWVALCEQLGIRGPGDEIRTPLRAGETRRNRKVDAGRTRLRQFLEGHLEQEWALTGIEAVICDRRGMALPPKAYQSQQQLKV